MKKLSIPALALMLAAPHAAADCSAQARTVVDALVEARILGPVSGADAVPVAIEALCANAAEPSDSVASAGALTEASVAGAQTETVIKRKADEEEEGERILGLEIKSAEAGSKGHQRLKRKR